MPSAPIPSPPPVDQAAGVASLRTLGTTSVQAAAGNDARFATSSGTNTGDVTLAAFGSAPAASGALLTAQVLTLQPADATHPGGVSLFAQTMGAGLKTFADGVSSTTGVFSSTISASNLTGTNTGDVTISAFSTSGTNAKGVAISGQALTFQSASASAPGMVDTGTQTFAGAKTWSAAATFSSTLGVAGAINSTVASGSNFLQSVQGAKLTFDGATAAKYLSSNGTTLTLTGLSFTAPSLVLAGSITGATTIAASGAITSSVASGSIAFSQLQGARFVTNGGTDTRYISDDGTNITLTGPLSTSSTITSNNATISAGTGNVQGGIFTPISSGASGLLRGIVSDGASAIGLKFYNSIALTTAGAKIAAFYSDNLSTQVASVSYLGGWSGTTGAFSGTVTSSVASGSIAFDVLPGARINFNSPSGNAYFSCPGGTTITAAGVLQAPVFMGSANATNVVMGDIRGSTAVSIRVGDRIGATTSGAQLMGFYADALSSTSTGKVAAVDAFGTWMGAGTLSGVVTISNCAVPTNATHTTATTGGTLAAGTYWFRVSALNSAGAETQAGTETSIVVPAGTSTNTITVKWLPVFGATSYKVYGRSTGAELFLATISTPGTFAWLDDGSVTPSGALPSGATTAALNIAGAITSSVASGSIAFSQLQGARFVTNGAAATRHISDDGSQIIVTGGMKSNLFMQAPLFAADANVALAIRGDIATGGSAIAIKAYNRQTLNTAGAVIMAWYADTGPTTAVASVDILGGYRSNQSNAALPTASSTYRGRALFGPDAASGVKDATSLCIKRIDDTYEWRKLQLQDSVLSSSSASITAADDSFIHVNAAGGNATVNLPAAATSTNRIYRIKKVDATANTVTIDGNASETIDGATTRVISTQWESVTIVCDGTGWFIH